MLKNSSSGKTELEGFCVDLISEIARLGSKLYKENSEYKQNNASWV